MKKYRHLTTPIMMSVMIISTLAPSHGYTDAYTDGRSESINAMKTKVVETSIPTPTPSPRITPSPVVTQTPAVTSAPTPKPKPTPTKCPYDENELDLLAHLINAEAGSDWCKDKMLYYVGSVVLNRMKHKDFPNTMHDVIYQKGQYACVSNGHINKEPTDRCWEIAEDLLVNGSVLPAKVIYQAEFRQGRGTWVIVQNMYFCYD